LAELNSQQSVIFDCRKFGLPTLKSSNKNFADDQQAVGELLVLQHLQSGNVGQDLRLVPQVPQPTATGGWRSLIVPISNQFHECLHGKEIIVCMYTCKVTVEEACWTKGIILF
jgi:hypothetical protein